ncbi:protein NinF [Pantoea sp. GbtcB22]|uniref:protein NinF n=1 Tax=Pantoea sp. GbtcB22 TaxID=2824767 RepID=UPI001C2FD448
MSNTTPSNPPTGAGELSALVCVFCAITLADCETYCCSACEVELMSDPNFRMCGGSDEESQKAM